MRRRVTFVWIFFSRRETTASASLQSSRNFTPVHSPTCTSPDLEFRNRVQMHLSLIGARR